MADRPIPLLRAPLVLALLVLGVSSLAAQDLFPDRVYPVGDDARTIAVLQLDGDAPPDLVVSQVNGFTPLRGLGDGTFESLPMVSGSGVSSSGWVTDLLVADMNSDGRDDVVTLHWNSAQIGVFLGDGAGGFTLFDSSSTNGTHPSGIAAADLDGDRDVDVVVGNEDNDTLGLLLNNGTGKLGNAVLLATGADRPHGVAVGDLDEDGDVDLVSANYGFPSTLSLLFGNGAGAFAPAVVVQMGPAAVWAGDQVQIADIDEDGHVDLVTNLSVRLGDGSGGFTTLLPPLSQYSKTVLVDFDQDGHLDVVEPSHDLTLRFGDGQGGVPSSASYDAGASAKAAAVADLDLDGDLDVAVLNMAIVGNFGDVKPMLNDGSASFPPLAAQLDLTGVLNAQFAAVADVDDDGALDIVAACYLGSSTAVAVIRGDSASGFLPGAAFQVNFPGGVHDLDLADLDGDGDEDVAVMFGQDSVVTLLGDGAGGFTALPPFTLGLPTTMQIALGDLDSDGLPDLVAIHFTQLGAKPVSIRLGDGLGGFGAPVTLPPLAAGTGLPKGLQLVDLDGDALLDLLIELGDGHFAICAGDGRGSLGAPVFHDGVGFMDVPADLDEDGDLDLVGRMFANDFAVGYVLNTGAGYSAPVVLSMEAGQPIVGDLDADGHLDLVLSHGAEQDFTCLLGDGTGQFTLHGTFLTGGLARGFVADLDGNGFDDYFALCQAEFGLAEHTSVVLNQTPSGWLGLAHALGGVNGAPHLGGKGALLPSTPVSLAIDDGKPFGSAVLVIGAAALMAPFKGGTMVPFPLQLIFGLPLNGAGHFGASGTWFGGLPSGTSVYFQAWIADAAGPAGFAATNGLKATTP